MARRAGVSQTAVSGTLAGQRKPGADFCIKIANAFSEPPEKLLRLAEYLPPSLVSEDGPVAEEVGEIMDILKNMNLNELRETLNYIRCLYQSGKKMYE